MYRRSVEEEDRGSESGESDEGGMLDFIAPEEGEAPLRPRKKSSKLPKDISNA